jgi:hypothetical protein
VHDEKREEHPERQAHRHRQAGAHVQQEATTTMHRGDDGLEQRLVRVAVVSRMSCERS